MLSSIRSFATMAKNATTYSIDVSVKEKMATLKEVIK
jgi:hypothetical protein